MAHGFGLWQCTTEREELVSSGYATTCVASRNRGLPHQDNVVLVFDLTVHSHRDPDSGFVQTDGLERKLLLAIYSRQGDEEKARFGDENHVF
jgi:hypothetical protein